MTAACFWTQKAGLSPLEVQVDESTSAQLPQHLLRLQIPIALDVSPPGPNTFSHTETISIPHFRVSSTL